MYDNGIYLKIMTYQQGQIERNTMRQILGRVQMQTQLQTFLQISEKKIKQKTSSKGNCSFFLLLISTIKAKTASIGSSDLELDCFKCSQKIMFEVSIPTQSREEYHKTSRNLNNSATSNSGQAKESHIFPIKTNQYHDAQATIEIQKHHIQTKQLVIALQ